MVDIDDLNENDLETLLQNPEVRKTLQYDDAGLGELRDELTNLLDVADDDDEEVYDLFTQGVADRSGRVTQATVQKVIEGMHEEVVSVMESTEDNEESDESDESE